MNEVESASAFYSGSDELGLFVRASIDPKVFSQTIIFKTAYWFSDQYYLFLASNEKTGLLDVEFRLKQGDSVEQLKAACGEFCNGLLDQAVRQRVLEETGSIRDTLLKKAFFEAKTPLPPGVISDESHIPSGNSALIDQSSK